MKYKIFVDGQEGTTGLKIYDHLIKRKDLDIVKISTEKKKNLKEKSKFMNSSDIVFLCLPDNASRESVSLITNKKTKIIDASTAHRVNPNWTYGFPELSTAQRIKIEKSSRVSIPGCHATGFTSIIYPLIKENILPRDYPITCTSITGYSGGGKKLISMYEKGKIVNKHSPKHYAVDLQHKHIPEMTKISGLINKPIFTPIVSNYYNGMVVTISLFPRMLRNKINLRELWLFFKNYYKDEFFINILPFQQNDTNLEEGFLNAEKCNGTNRIDILILGNDQQFNIFSRFDNLGKGASGAAIQNMNIMLGLDEKTGLDFSNYFG